ncbi:ISL3 family transposase [Brachybacterium alimentarium]
MMSGLLPLLAPRTSTMLNHSCVCPAALDRCDRCDLLLDFPGLHLVAVSKARAGLVLEVESCDPVTGCPGCGVIATGHGRIVVEVLDAPWAGRPVRIRWRKRRWVCLEDVCEVATFLEQDPEVCAPRGLLSTRAIRWAIGQLRREGATIQGLARQLGTTWNTLWSQVQPVLTRAAEDPSRFEGVQVLGVDEHIWHHRDPRRRGPKALTGMVDLTRGTHPTARLLDLVPGRSGTVYRDWLDERGERFREGIEIATLDPFQGYKNAIDDQLEDATCVLDAFYIVKLAGAAVDDVRRRIQQETLAHRGRKGDPLFGIRHVLRAGRERLTTRQQNRLARAFAAHPDHVAVEVAYQCAQDLRDVFHQPTPAQGRRLAERLIDTLPSCPIPEIARLGKTLRRWKTAFLAYFDTDGASNGGTEAICESGSG